ncbi:hypothetical protein [Saccharothrix sp.]|uniref:hypothetical protein n=1 Tax=Saccharothrix sp. TaxID=1873460 RepID=UPI00281134BF|nr:hypothetical protein [Saccharothrix sp.]
MLELNLGSRAGRIESARIGPTVLAHEAFRDFAAEHGLSSVDTVEQLAAALRDLTGKPSPVAAVLDLKGILTDYVPLIEVHTEALAEPGIEVFFGDLFDVRRGGGRLLGAGGLRTSCCATSPTRRSPRTGKWPNSSS